METHTPTSKSPVDQVREAIEHLHHVLPAQGPILNFVHENTLEGFQALPFTQAVRAYKTMTGVTGYMDESLFRESFRRGRVNTGDLEAAIGKMPALSPDQVIGGNDLQLRHADIYHLALLYPFPALSPAALKWRLTQEHALTRPQPDIPAGKGASAPDLTRLWSHIRATLPTSRPHAAVAGDAEIPVPSSEPSIGQARDTAIARVESLLGQTGVSLSLPGLVGAVSGVDVRESVLPVMLRLSASLLDEGTAPWHLGDNHFSSLYPAWKHSASRDMGLKLDDIDLSAELAGLPEDAEMAVVQQLDSLALPREIWPDYLQRLCLEAPGWTGLINWRQRHPGYHCVNPLQPKLADWLAIRLTLDKLYLNKTCRQLWQCDGDFKSLGDCFRNHPLRTWLCHDWRNGELDEFHAQRVAGLCRLENEKPGDWLSLGQQVLAAAIPAGHKDHDQGWKLFRLCQHLGLVDRVSALDTAVLGDMLSVLEGFDLDTRSQVWLLAYEMHYRNDLFRGIDANYRRGHWVKRTGRPQAQIVMCMDEREESFRRHLEEINPHIETLGAAGFFGVPIKYRALDDTHLTPLCPVVVTPAHRVEEIPRQPGDELVPKHERGFSLLFRYLYLLHQGFRLNPLYNLLGGFLLAPFSLIGQLLHSLLPGPYKAVVDGIRLNLVNPVVTTLTITTDTPELPATIEDPRLGFTDEEQAQRTGSLLRTLGLTGNFAPLVVLSGHGSTSQNNPHEAAHDCGACGGRQGGPNARAYAAMINRPQVRQLLAAEGIHIPADTWFIGTQHDTCHDGITWYDTDLIPEQLTDNFQRFRRDIGKAQALSAHERCRRFYSAADPATAEQAFRHVTLRARDLSQVRPEYGHATNASAVIGRRNLTLGLFLDRRTFLISYDPTQDPEGRILENILLTAGPVGAGINLEYYFSTIDNDRFGCGTKIPHNVTGMFGVMEGTGSDLRPGLPEQMVEIHEPMRLLVLVEHKTEVLGRIYGDQPALQELIGGGWLLLAAKDPDSADIQVFEPDIGFVPWQGDEVQLRECPGSTECYAGIHSPIAPILIRQPGLAGAP